MPPHTTRQLERGGVPPPRLLSLKKIIMNPRVRLLGPAPDPAASAGLNRGVEGTGGFAEDSCSDDDARLGALVMVGRGWGKGRRGKEGEGVCGCEIFNQAEEEDEMKHRCTNVRSQVGGRWVKAEGNFRMGRRRRRSCWVVAKTTRARWRFQRCGALQSWFRRLLRREGRRRSAARNRAGGVCRGRI